MYSCVKWKLAFRKNRAKKKTMLEQGGKWLLLLNSVICISGYE